MSHNAPALDDPRAKFFDKRASGWEEHCYPPETRARLQELIACFGLKPGMDILDLGCGSGVLGPYLRAATDQNATLFAVDLSGAMVALAESKKVYTVCHQASAMLLPMQDQCVDTVICFAAFPHFSDKATALQEMFRVLRTGGSVAIAHLLSREELCRHHSGKSAVSDDHLPDNATMRDLFLDAGFTTPAITDIPGRYTAQASKR